MRKVTASLVVAAMMITPTVFAAPSTTETPAYGDYSSTNPGRELVLPFTTDKDNNYDGLPDATIIQIDVYPANGGARLYSTSPKTHSYSYPTWVNSCLLADIRAWQPESDGLYAGSRIVLAGGDTIKCLDNGLLKEYGRVAVYGASLASANGASWLYQRDGDFVAATLRDSDDNGIFEHVVVLIQVPAVSGNGRDVLAVKLNLSNGNVVSTTRYRNFRN